MPAPKNAGYRRLVGAVLTLLLLWLPALVGGLTIDTAARPGELGRVSEGLQPDATSTRSWPAQLYYASALPSQPETGDAQKLLPRARLASVLGVLAISCLLYLTLAVTRRRSTGLLACLALCCLPPVYLDGAVLRPEVPAAVFGGLAMLLITGFPVLLRSPARPRWPTQLAFMMAIGSAVGLAVSSLPSAGVYLLVPGGGLMLMVGALVLTVPRLLRRRPVDRVPFAEMQRRIVPWLLMTLINVMATLFLLLTFVHGEVTELIGTRTDAGLLPSNAAASTALVALAVLGGMRLLLGVGLRLGRLRRVAPDALLLIFSAALLLQWVASTRTSDALMAAPAVAILIAEGATTVLLWIVGRIYRSGIARQAATNIA